MQRYANSLFYLIFSKIKQEIKISGILFHVLLLKKKPCPSNQKKCFFVKMHQ